MPYCLSRAKRECAAAPRVTTVGWAIMRCADAVRGARMHLVNTSGTDVSGDPTATILDVLENSLEDLSREHVARLTKGELERLAEVVNAFYDAWTPPPVPAA